MPCIIQNYSYMIMFHRSFAGLHEYRRYVLSYSVLFFCCTMLYITTTVLWNDVRQMMYMVISYSYSFRTFLLCSIKSISISFYGEPLLSFFLSLDRCCCNEQNKHTNSALGAAIQRKKVQNDISMCYCLVTIKIVPMMLMLMLMAILILVLRNHYHQYRHHHEYQQVVASSRHGRDSLKITAMLQIIRMVNFVPTSNYKRRPGMRSTNSSVS